MVDGFISHLEPCPEWATATSLRQDRLFYLDLSCLHPALHNLNGVQLGCQPFSQSASSGVSHTLCLVGWSQALKLHPRRSQPTRPIRLLNLYLFRSWMKLLTWESGHRRWNAIVKLFGHRNQKIQNPKIQISSSICVQSGGNNVVCCGGRGMIVVLPGLECTSSTRMGLSILWGERMKRNPSEAKMER